MLMVILVWYVCVERRSDNEVDFGKKNYFV